MALLGLTPEVLEQLVLEQAPLLRVVLEQALRRSPCEESLQVPPLARLPRGFALNRELALNRLLRHPQRVTLRRAQLEPWQSMAEVPVPRIRPQRLLLDRLDPQLWSLLRSRALPLPFSLATSLLEPSWQAPSWPQLS